MFICCFEFFRVVETAIREAQIKELKEEIKGVLNLYQSLADSLQHFRKENEADSKYVSIEQGIAFYSHAFQELVLFGKLKEAIKEHCNTGVLDYGFYNGDHNEGVVKKAKSCSAFVRLYAQLSIQRQFFLMDVAMVINDAATADPSAKAALQQTSQNFLEIMEKEQERDKELLSFLISPINHPQHGYAVYYFYDFPTQNGLAISYLKSMCDIFKDFCPPTLTACTKHFLEGRCVTFPEVSIYNILSSVTWYSN